MKLPKIGFAGMTHLGQNSAVASAARGANVICFDNDSILVKLLTSGKTHIVEPDLEILMDRHRDRLSYTSDANELSNCRLVYIAPDVPTDDHGNSDLSSLTKLIDEIDDILPPHIVMVILSQIPPGFSRNLRLKPGRELYYQVETLIFGQAVERAMNPERIIIGCKRPEVPLHEVYQSYLSAFGCPLIPMRYESAELTKISINCCLVASISIANTLAEICENIGADWSEIVPALKSDRRIGQYAYLTPGLGISGGNLERDLNTVCDLANRYGSDAGVVKAWICNSAYRKNWVLRVFNQHIMREEDCPDVTVWGLAYKENTDSTKNSPSLEFIKHLGFLQVTAYDPVVSAVDLLARPLLSADSALTACDEADVLAIMTPWSEFKQISPHDIVERMRGKWVLDPYRVLDESACRLAGLNYMTLGS